MKVAVFSPHFLPRFIGGVECRAYRIAQRFQENGHYPQVMSVESVTHSGTEAFCQDENYQGIPVRRIFFNQTASPDLFRWSFSNPLLEKEASSFLEAFQPDMLLVFSGNLLSGSVISAAFDRAIPVFLMTTDFWFLCPRVTLLKPDGTLCHTPGNPVECAVCLCLDKRRYRMISRLTGGISSRFLTKMWGLPFLARAMGKNEMLDSLEERRIYLKTIFQKVDLAVSESRFLKTVLLSRGYKARRFLQIRQGTRMPVKEHSTSEKKGIPLRIGYIGQIAPHKGVDVLLRAFLRLSHQTTHSILQIYGDTSRDPKYVQRLKHLAGKNETIEFCGPFSNEKVYEILREIDVLVVPSLWFENSPNVILEAFASRTPVIVSNLGGMKEVVENGINGLLFRRGDDQDLYRQLRRLIDEPGLLDFLCRSIRSVKTEEQEMEEILELSRQLMGKNRKAGQL